MEKNHKLYRFLFLLMFFAIIAGLVSWFGKEYFNPIYFVGTPYMLTPLLSVCFVEKWKIKEIFNSYQLRLEKKYIWDTVKYIAYTGVLIPLLIILITYVLGNMCNLPIFGRVLSPHEPITMRIFFDTMKFEEVAVNSPVLSFLSGPHRFSIGLPVLLLGSTILGFMNVPFALGEEVGWRGFMEKNVHFPKIKKYIFIGAIWGIWHTPLILIGFNYSEHNILGILMMMIVCITLSFYFSQALHRTHSLLVPTIMHGLINASSFFLILELGNPLLGPRIGIVFVTALWVMIYINYLNNNFFCNEK